MLATNEQLISLSKAARLIPSARAQHPSPVTLWRWSRRGLRTASGTRVSLETIRVGAARMTSAEAVQRFLHALNELDGPAEAPARDLEEEARARRNVRLDSRTKEEHR